MSKSKLLSALFMFILLLSGCNEDVEKTKQVDFNLLASENVAPTKFYDIALQQNYLVRKSVIESEFEENWNLYGFKQDVPNVDFNENDVFFIIIEESGSCPEMIKSIRLNSENNTMKISFSSKDGACSSDATPRTFVIQLEKELSEKINSLIIVNNNVETNVPLN